MPADAAHPHLSPNLLADAGRVLEYHFMLDALAAGGVAAVLAGLVGWLMTIRREAFAGHTLAIMSFPGAGAAALLGIPAAWGYFAFCGAGGLAIAGLGGGRERPAGERSAAIGIVQAGALAAGFLFVSLYGGVLGDLDGLLFGNLLGVSDTQVLVLAAVAVAVGAVLLVVGRPLLFASVDPQVAAARGLPVRALGAVFLVALGLTVAEASQVTGALLVFALLVMPAAGAQALTARPALSLALTLAFALTSVWVGLGASYFSVYPPGFFVAIVAFGLYVVARSAGAGWTRTRAVGA